MFIVLFNINIYTDLIYRDFAYQSSRGKETLLKPDDVRLTSKTIVNPLKKEFTDSGTKKESETSLKITGTIKKLKSYRHWK